MIFFSFFWIEKKTRVPSRIDLQNSFEVFFLVLKNRHTFPLEFPTRNLNFVVFLFVLPCVFFSEKPTCSSLFKPLGGRVVQHGAAVSNRRGALMPSLVNLKMSMKLGCLDG